MCAKYMGCYVISAIELGRCSIRCGRRMFSNFGYDSGDKYNSNIDVGDQHKWCGERRYVLVHTRTQSNITVKLTLILIKIYCLYSHRWNVLYDIAKFRS